MGDWVVLTAWNLSTDGYHECRFGGTAAEILYAQCFPVVEQHQDQGPQVPEFTISVKWQEGDLHDYLAGRNSKAHGWRYVLTWAEGDRKRFVTGYGYATDSLAREAAEAKATKIVKAQLPEQVYKFKPNLED